MQQLRISDEEQFCRLIQSTIDKLIDPLKDPRFSFWDDSDLKVIRPHFKILQNAFNDLIPKEKQEEDNRPEYKIPVSEYYLHKDEEKKLDEAEKEIEKLVQETEREKQVLQDKKRLITEQSQLELDKKTMQTEGKIEKENRKEDFERQKKVLLQANCCLRFFPCCSSQEAKLKELNEKIEQLSTSSISQQNMKSDPVKTHKQALEDLDEKIIQLDKDFIEKKKAAETVRDQEQKILDKLEEEEEEKEENYYDKVSAKTMIEYVRTFVAFIALNNTIESCCIEKSKIGKKIPATLMNLRKQVGENKSQLEAFTKKLAWTEDFDLKANLIYRNYQNLSPEEQSQLLIGRMDGRLMTKLFMIPGNSLSHHGVSPQAHSS